MKIKLSDILELIMWVCLVISLCMKESYWSLVVSIVGLIISIIFVSVSKIEDNKEIKKDLEEE